MLRTRPKKNGNIFGPEAACAELPTLPVGTDEQFPSSSTGFLLTDARRDRRMCKQPGAAAKLDEDFDFP